MPDKRVGRVTITQAMAIVAAMTPGLIAARYFLPFARENPSLMKFSQAFYFHVALSLELWLTVLSPCFLMLTVVSLALHRQDRTWRRMFRRPGIAASVSALLVLGALASGAAFGELVHSSGDYINFSWRVLANFACVNGLTVGALWAVLLLGGMWHPARSPGDRLGRLLGAFWIALAVIYGVLVPLASLTKP